MLGGAAFLAYQMLKPQAEDGGGGILDSLLPGDLPEVGGLDLGGIFSGLFSGIGEMIGGIMGGLPGGDGSIPGDAANIWATIQDWMKNPPWLPPDGGGGGGGGGGNGDGNGHTEPPDKPGFFDPLQPTGSVITDLANAVMGVGKAALTGAGVYAGVKVGLPLATAVGRAITPAVTQIAARGLGLANSGLGAVRTGLGAAAGYLGTPLSALGVAGWAGAIPLAAAAGYGGWQLGQMFNESRAGQALQTWSGNLGASVARGNNPIQAVFFPRSNVNMVAMANAAPNIYRRYGVTAQQLINMTTTQQRVILHNAAGAPLPTIGGYSPNSRQVRLITPNPTTRYTSTGQPIVNIIGGAR